MRKFARAYDDIWKKLFPRVASRSLKWENKMYKPKRPITLGTENENDVDTPSCCILETITEVT